MRLAMVLASSTSRRTSFLDAPARRLACGEEDEFATQEDGCLSLPTGSDCPRCVLIGNFGVAGGEGGLGERLVEGSVDTRSGDGDPAGVAAAFGEDVAGDLGVAG